MKKKASLLVVIFGLITLSCSQNQDSSSSPANSQNQHPAIMAYYVAPSENFKPDELPLNKLSHIIFCFTEVIANEIKFTNPQKIPQLQTLVEQKTNHPKLKVMVACGGWGGSGGFSDMAASSATRNSFVESTIRLIEDHDLDGIDMDWEYPGLPGNGNPHMPEDKENFTLLMKELREAMDATGKDLVLSFASAGWERYYDHIETLEVMKYADYMNVMTYDFITGYSEFTGHHTNLGWIRPEDQKKMANKAVWDDFNYLESPASAEKILDYVINLGVNPKQLVIGAAFYGRAWKGVPPENNGLYQPNKGVWEGWASYSNLKENYEDKNGFEYYWDSIAKAPWLYSKTDSVFISYDDRRSVALKTQYAKDMNLGGIMFWQLASDAKEEGLLDAIYFRAVSD